MNLDINDEQLQTLINGAIASAIGPEQRDALVTKAIEHLLTPTNERYGQPKTSPIQEAFNTAAGNIARQYFRDELAADSEFKSKLKELSKRVVDKFFDEHSEEVTQKLALALATALTSADY